ncbi:MAG TPA: V-type ATP synthase subunit A, partial [Methanomassiliicoccales archaeon]|nr:V-type ATP synthase subunit A [Methanomassiliicoccales archaeon]
NAYHKVDTYSPMIRQYKLLKIIKMFNDFAVKAVEGEISVDTISKMPVRDRLQKSKLEDNVDQTLDDIMANLGKEFEKLGAK